MVGAEIRNVNASNTFPILNIVASIGATVCSIDPASSAALIKIKAPQILKTGSDRRCNRMRRWPTCLRPKTAVNAKTKPICRAAESEHSGYVVDRHLDLRTRLRELSLRPKDIAVEIGDPLTPARRDVEIADGGLNLRRDVRPIKLRVFVNDIGGCVIAERLVQPGFLKLIEQRIRLPHVVGVAKLANQIGRAQ